MQVSSQEGMNSRKQQHAIVYPSSENLYLGQNLVLKKTMSSLIDETFDSAP